MAPLKFNRKYSPAILRRNVRRNRYFINFPKRNGEEEMAATLDDCRRTMRVMLSRKIRTSARIKPVYAISKGRFIVFTRWYRFSMLR